MVELIEVSEGRKERQAQNPNTNHTDERLQVRLALARFRPLPGVPILGGLVRAKPRLHERL